MILGLWLSPTTTRDRILHSGLVALLASTLLIVGYVAVYLATRSSPASLSGFLTYCMGYIGDMPMLPGDSGFSRFTIPRAVMGLSQAVISGNILFWWDWSYERIQASLSAKYLIDDRFLVRNLTTSEVIVATLSGCAFALTLVGVILTQIGRVRLRTRNRFFVLFAAWFLLQALFFSWWEAGSNEFWISSLVPLTLCLHLLLCPIEAGWRQLWPGVVMAIALFFVNGISAIRPCMNPENDYWMANKTYLTQVSPDDVVITFDSHTPRLDAIYFTDAVTIDLFPYPGEKLNEESVFEHLESTVARGGRIIIDPRAWWPDRVTRTTSRYYTPEAAKRLPSLLREIIARYPEATYLAPLCAPGVDDPAPIVTPEPSRMLLPH
jgi:hypothetical protein